MIAKKTPLAWSGWAAAGVGGLVGVGLAAGGAPWVGVVAWAIGGSVGAFLTHRARHSTASLRSLEDLVRLAAADPEHPLAAVVGQVREVGERIDEHGRAVREAVRNLQEHATLVAWVIDTLNVAVSGTRESLDAMKEVMGQVGENAGQVLAASEQGVEFIDAMGASTESLFQGAETLNQSVVEASASIVQIHGALSSVEAGLALLSEASDRNTAFISQVGEAMGAVRERVDQSLELSKKVETSAGRGREVVEKVGDSVGEIQKTSLAMMESVHALGRQSQEIEGILGIITDVAEETGLLSLNAAILAAQAGEKGAAFAVVAEQIRSLARRTRESTKNIEVLIRGIQSNITDANLGLAANLEAVEEGRGLGREAVEQLQQIEAAVAESVEQARQIAAASQEQDRSSKAMVNAAGEVNENLHQVAESLRQSTSEMDRIQALIQTLSALSESVHAAADEHRATGWKTAELMGSFAHLVEGIHAGVDRQREKATGMEGALEQLVDSSDSTRESLDTLHSIVNDMVAHADGVRGEVALFQGRDDGSEEEVQADGE